MRDRRVKWNSWKRSFPRGIYRSPMLPRESSPQYLKRCWPSDGWPTTGSYFLGIHRRDPRPLRFRSPIAAWLRKSAFPCPLLATVRPRPSDSAAGKSNPAYLALVSSIIPPFGTLLLPNKGKESETKCCIGLECIRLGIVWCWWSSWCILWSDHHFVFDSVESCNHLSGTTRLSSALAEKSDRVDE